MVRVFLQKNFTRHITIEYLLLTTERIGHAATIVFSALFTLTFIFFKGGSLVGQIFYRGLFLAVSVTYGLALYQRFGGETPSFFVLLRMENFQYGILGLLWLISRYHWIKIVPFLGISLLQASYYVETELKPGTPLARQIEDFRTKHIVLLSEAIAWTNFLIMLRLFIELITFRRGSAVGFLAFGFFLRIRLAYSLEQQKVLLKLREVVEEKINQPSTPAKIKDLWLKATVSGEAYDHYELDPKKAKAKAAQKKKALEEDREAASKARETFESEVKATGSSI